MKTAKSEVEDMKGYDKETIDTGSDRKTEERVS